MGQCGLYRSGTLWAHSAYPTDCHPDMVTMAKPLANGYPIGAIMMRDKFAEHIAVGESPVSPRTKNTISHVGIS